MGGRESGRLGAVHSHLSSKYFISIPTTLPNDVRNGISVG